jgi:hypothetical protein
MTGADEVEYGAHLPLVGLGADPSLAALRAYAGAAVRLGYRYLCANDHLVFSRPWLDGPAAGVGPGSSAADYAAAGIAFQERWPRFDEALRALCGLLHGEGDGFEGAFYSTRGVALDPRPAQRPGPLPRGPGAARRRAAAGRQGARVVPDRDRHQLAVRHRGPGRSGAGARRGAGNGSPPWSQGNPGRGSGPPTPSAGPAACPCPTPRGTPGCPWCRPGWPGWSRAGRRS